MYWIQFYSIYKNSGKFTPHNRNSIKLVLSFEVYFLFIFVISWSVMADITSFDNDAIITKLLEGKSKTSKSDKHDLRNRMIV